MQTPSPQRWPPASDAVSVRSVWTSAPASQRLAPSASSPLHFRRPAARSRYPRDLSALRLECPKRAATPRKAEIDDAALQCRCWVSRPLPTCISVRMDRQTKTLTTRVGRNRKGRERGTACTRVYHRPAFSNAGRALTARVSMAARRGHRDQAEGGGGGGDGLVRSTEDHRAARLRG